MAAYLQLLDSCRLVFLRTGDIMYSHVALTRAMEAIGFSGAVDVCYDESGIYWRQFFVPSCPWFMACIPVLPIARIDDETLLSFINMVEDYTNSREFGLWYPR
ncbi:hypothetical protein O6H91_16G090600 [Diphasiastrum complanatum]|uniref:Uncharacterized protein n=1 Tax=Diphasiastrum complanatum TaxID=34168 RepID=A0ACC2BET0_DIPCM|nr:hypothetical protein O6H91_16G090600 [Diphasiastrum complanatum]